MLITSLLFFILYIIALFFKIKVLLIYPLKIKYFYISLNIDNSVNELVVSKTNEDKIVNCIMMIMDAYNCFIIAIP